MRVLSRLPLRALLTLPFIGLVLLLALVIGLLSYKAGRDALDTWSEQLLIETVKRTEQAVALHVSGSAAVLEAAFPAGVAAPVSIANDLDALRTRFWLATSVHRDLNNYAYYGDRQGHFFGLWRQSEGDAELRLRTDGSGPRTIYHYHGIDGPLGPPEREAKTFEPRSRPWFQAGQSAPLHTWTSVYIDFRLRELVATRARRVPDRDGQFQGVVATDLSLRRIDDFVKRLTLSPNGVALIAEPDGKLIGVSKGPHLTNNGDGQPRRLAAIDSPDPLVAATFRAVSALPADQSGATSDARAAHFTTADGRIIQVGYARLLDDAGLDWLVMVAVPRDDFIHQVSESFRQSLLLGVLAAIAVALLGLWVLRTIANELRVLAAAARRIGSGDLSTPPSTERRDELGDLARTFADMQSRLLTDQLTGLSNRTAALKRIEDRLHRHRRDGDQKQFALLFVDADGFKLINDRLGHDGGDRMLREIGQRIRESVRASDLVARYAGDEFLVMIGEVGSRGEADRKRTDIEARLRESVTWLSPEQAGSIRIGATIGLAVFPEDGRNVETLIRAADQDMYRRKSVSRQGQPQASGQRDNPA